MLISPTTKIAIGLYRIFFSILNELPRSKLTGYPKQTAKTEAQQAAGNYTLFLIKLDIIPYQFCLKVL
jgi:hypothetical protein